MFFPKRKIGKEIAYIFFLTDKETRRSRITNETPDQVAEIIEKEEIGDD